MRLNLGLPHHCQNVYLISNCTGSGTRRCRCNTVQPLAGYVYPGNSINFSTVKLLHLCPEGASTSITSLQQKHTGRSSWSSPSCIIISFQENIKIYLLTVFFQPALFLNFRKMGEWLVIGGGIRSHLQASQRGSQATKSGWAGWPTEKTGQRVSSWRCNLRTEVGQCLRGLNWGKPLRRWTVSEYSGCT